MVIKEKINIQSTTVSGLLWTPKIMPDLYVTFA
jgi:hypothetical protein